MVNFPHPIRLATDQPQSAAEAPRFSLNFPPLGADIANFRLDCTAFGGFSSSEVGDDSAATVCFMPTRWGVAVLSHLIIPAKNLIAAKVPVTLIVPQASW
jgi:hypothetical protein